MIAITAIGRLAAQPELKMISGGYQVCEFRLLDTRFSKGQEVTEAVTFFCYGEMAEDFCSSTVKGQEISATGTQETQSYTPADGPTKHYVKYRLNWYKAGRKPYTGDRSQGQAGGYPAQSNQAPAQRQSAAPTPGVRPAQRQPNPGGHYESQDSGFQHSEPGFLP